MFSRVRDSKFHFFDVWSCRPGPNCSIFSMLATLGDLVHFRWHVTVSRRDTVRQFTSDRCIKFRPVTLECRVQAVLALDFLSAEDDKATHKPCSISSCESQSLLDEIEQAPDSNFSSSHCMFVNSQKSAMYVQGITRSLFT